jgi:PadR family transcriptional regulator, regulatory protein AphA
LSQRPLTDFEQILLGLITGEPYSGYRLKKLFSSTPAAVYQRSPGALYPALRRLTAWGLISVEETVSAGRRPLRIYHATEAGRAMHLEWLSQPVSPATVSPDLGLHLMRFAMMDQHLPREQVLAFLRSLADALAAFVDGMRKYLALGAETSRPHAELALMHGIAVHQASLDWALMAIKTLSGDSSAA